LLLHRSLIELSFDFHGHLFALRAWRRHPSYEVDCLTRKGCLTLPA
jgi:hypothetical protein